MINKMMILRSCLLTLSLIFIDCIQVSSQVFKNDDLEISKLEENVWVIETTDKTTMYLIEGTKKALLIDTGTKCEKLYEVIRKITTKPFSVVITHIHGDHAGNMDQFSEVFFHAADTVLLSRNNPYKGIIHYVGDGDQFDLGGIVIDVVHTPAHTPGSIVLLDKKAGICYSGDAFGSGQVWLQLRPSSPMKTYVESCKKMEELMDKGITKIYCGHYPYVKKAYDKSYITSMRKLAEALDNGTAPDSKPFTTKISIGGNNPMMTTLGEATIVYDTEFIK
jgi:hydroxyacylglutathione hydrolase